MSAADGASGENEFLFNKLNDFRVDAEDDKKPKFEFRLAGLGVVCREAWILAVGLYPTATTAVFECWRLVSGKVGRRRFVTAEKFQDH